MRIPYRFLGSALIACATLLAASCAQEPRPQSTAALAASQPSSRPAEERLLGPGPEVPKMDVVPSQGSCAPEKKTPFALVACCNGKDACRGQCVHDASGGVACACYDTAGGCREGQVCCHFRHACTALLDCSPPS